MSENPTHPGDALAILPPERIERCIYVIRGQRVMLDADLASFYGVATRALNQAVKRNAGRFPADFVFQLTQAEAESLRSQFVTLDVIGPEAAGAQNGSHRGKHRKYRPYAFTEHGALMAASVLHSQRAVEMSLLVVRAFVRLRQILIDHTELARRIEALEREFVHKTAEHEQHIRRIWDILDELMNPCEPRKKSRIGFAERSAES
jgi:hypothetical protein